MDDLQDYEALLGHDVLVRIDRPKGSLHPEHGFVYEVNYGFIPGTRAGDGQEMDAYVLGESEPMTEYTGPCVAIIVRRDDDEHKLVVSRLPVTAGQIAEQTAFVEQYFETEIVLRPTQ